MTDHYDYASKTLVTEFIKYVARLHGVTPDDIVEIRVHADTTCTVLVHLRDDDGKKYLEPDPDNGGDRVAQRELTKPIFWHTRSLDE